MDKECSWCGKTFDDGSFFGGGKAFCSLKCADAFERKGYEIKDKDKKSNVTGCSWLIVGVVIIALYMGKENNKNSNDSNLEDEEKFKPGRYLKYPEDHDREKAAPVSTPYEIKIPDWTSNDNRQGGAKTSIRQSINNIVKKIIDADSNRSIVQCSEFYASTIVSNGKTMTKNEFLGLMRDHFQKWPKVRWKMIGEPQVSKQRNKNIYEVTYKASYRVESPERNKWSEGKVLSTLKMIHTEDESFLINQVDDKTYDMSHGKLY